MTGIPYILADVATNAAETLTISEPLLNRLAVLLAAGCVTGLFLGFFVRGLRVGSAVAGGTIGGVLAAVGFLLVGPMYGEMIGFIVAGGLLALSMTLMLVRARPCAAEADDDEADAMTTLSSPVPMKTQAAAKTAPKPDPKPDPKSDPDPVPSAKLSAPPKLDPDPTPADESESKPAPAKTPAPTPPGLAPALLRTAAPGSKTPPKEDDEAPPKSAAPQKIAHKTSKKPSAIPSPPKPNLKPKPTQGSQGSSTSPSWMQDH